MTLSTAIGFFWNQRQHRKTITLDQSLNIDITDTAFGAKTFQAFMTLNDHPNHDAAIFVTHIIPNDPEGDDNEASLQPPNPVQARNQRERNLEHDEVQTKENARPQTIMDFLHHTTPDDREPTTINPHDELLRWHHRLAHLSFKRIRRMCKKGILPRQLLDVKEPFCAACQYGKQYRTPWKTKGKAAGVRIATKPGEIISVDQLESTTLGFIAQLKSGITRQRYKFATVFVDHFPRLSFVYLQKTITSHETVLAKQAWENFAAQHQIRASHYHADNGRFADNGFIAHCRQQNQGISYCGVNAHFQNGIAEKRIRDLQESTRTALLYAIHKWPQMLTVHLWPYALRTVNEVHNATPTRKGEASPLEMFSQVPVRPKLRHFHTFGCPVYVLDNNLQAQHAIDKWKSRARLSVYLGPLPNHSRSGHLVLNPRTAHVSPQFHVQHDDFFETVTDKSTHYDSPQPEWRYISGLSERLIKKDATRGISLACPGKVVTLDINNPPGPEPADPVAQADQEPTDLDEPAVPDQILELEPPIYAPTETPRQTRSGRIVRDTLRFKEGQQQRREGLVAWEVMINQDEQETRPTAQQQFDLQRQMDNPLAFAATADPDTMYYHEAMQQPDRDQFKLAMQKEIHDHELRHHWEIVLKSEILFGTCILDMVWSMKRKRRIDMREIYKWKSQLNVHGGQQEYGVNYWDTYAPVVNWQTLQLFFVLSLLKGWHNRQMDLCWPIRTHWQKSHCTSTFLRGISFHQASPRTHTDLNWYGTSYGQRQAGRVWNKYLEAGLFELGFKPSTVDPCLYSLDNVVLLVYIDDCILFSPDNKALDKVVAKIKGTKKKFCVDDMETVNDFLGVKVRPLPDGSIELTQPHLIDSILQDLHFQPTTASRTTPALSTTLLHKDESGTSGNHDFHYRRVIGKLNFLEKSTRPDISYAVHQCARFSVDPKKSHADAVKQIGKYLIDIKTKGIILKRDCLKSFECWVDADFCSGFRPEGNNASEPMTSKSRSGWVITYGGCPITWASKMQTLTALSSTEAEYIALSTALRDIIPLMEMSKEMVT